MSIEPTQAISTVTAEKVGLAIAAPARPSIVSVHAGTGELLRITPTGEVIAPSLEAASEAGRVFVDSIRHHLQPSTPASGEVVAWMYERNGSWPARYIHDERTPEYFTNGGDEWTETPLYAAPSHPAADLVEALEIMATAFAGYADTDAKREAVASARAALSRYAGGA